MVDRMKVEGKHNYNIKKQTEGIQLENRRE